MYYHQLWTNTTDIPLRAIDEDLVPDRFGTLNPTDGGRAQRASFSAQYHETIGVGQFSASGYLIYNELHLYNDFTHYLVDPIHGDQEDQFENRHMIGGTANYTLPVPLGSIDNELSVGVLTRYDSLDVGRLPSEDRVPLPAQDDPPSFSDSDQVYLFSGAAYLQATTHWTSQLRSVLGVRVDYQHGTDIDYLAALHETDGYTNGGTDSQTLPQPKASLIFTVDPVARALRERRRRVSQRRPARREPGQERRPRTARTRRCSLPSGERRSACARSRAAISRSPWRSTTSGSSPRRSSTRTSARTRRDLRAVATASSSMSPIRSGVGSSSTAASQATTPASHDPFDDGTGHLGTYITDAPVATGSLALYLTEPRSLERRTGVPLPRQLSAVLGSVRQLGSGQGLPGRGHFLRQCTDGARAGQWRGVRRTEPSCALRASARAGARRSVSTTCSTRTQPRRSSGTSIDCKRRLPNIPTDGPISTSTRSSRIMARLTITKELGL